MRPAAAAAAARLLARARSSRRGGRGWATFDRITVQRTEAHPELVEGPTLSELASQRGHPLDMMCDIALADNLRTRFQGCPGKR